MFQGDIESEGLTEQKFKEEDLDLNSMDHLDYEQYRLGFCDKIILKGETGTKRTRVFHLAQN